LKQGLGVADKINAIVKITYPDIAERILKKASNIAGRKHVVVGGYDIAELYVFGTHEHGAVQVEDANPAISRRYPERSVIHFPDVLNLVGNQRKRVVFFMFETQKTVGLRIVESQSLFCTYPHIFLLVDTD
jgi:hypothetical protein